MRSARVLCIVALAAALDACRLWYRPIPIANAIGAERVLVASDSFSVHRDPRFEVYGPGSQAVFDAYEQLNRAYRAFDRHFGSPTPRLGVVLMETDGRPDLAVERALRERGLVPLRYARPYRARMQERSGEAGYEGALWPVGPTSARALLASFAHVVDSAAPARFDTTTLARFPVWYRSAVMRLVGDAASLPYDVEYTRENRGSRLTIERLVGTERPPAADSTLDPSRRSDADDHDRRLASQASAFAQFLLEREGPDVLRRLGLGFARGQTFVEQAREFRVVPKDLPDLDERWMAWLAAQREEYWRAQERYVLFAGRLYLRRTPLNIEARCRPAVLA